MSRIFAVHRVAGVTLAGAFAAISLAACGGGSTGAGSRESLSTASSVSATGSSTAASTLSSNTSASQTTSSEAAAPAKARRGLAEREAVYAFIECVRTHGVVMPPPNRSGKGPIYNAKGVNNTTPTFKHARAVCLPKAEAAIRAAGR
jgi:hypothetical protein